MPNQTCVVRFKAGPDAYRARVLAGNRMKRKVGNFRNEHHKYLEDRDRRVYKNGYWTFVFVKKGDQ